MPPLRVRQYRNTTISGTFLIRLLLLITLLTSGVTTMYAQDVQGLLSLIEQGRVDSVQSLLEDLSFQYPGHPGIRYVRAILERDALVAAGIYKDITRNHQGTPFEAPALYRLGEYYYAQGLYIQSRQHLVDLNTRYPENDQYVIATNLALRAAVAARQLDSAYADLTRALRTHPTAAFEIPDELDPTRLPPGIRSASSEPPPRESGRTLRELGAPAVPDVSDLPSGSYVLQAGAFSSEENAQNLKSQIEAVGYPVEIKPKNVGGRTLYLVWVGRYVDRDAAGRATGLLESALGITPYPVEVP